MGVLFSDAVTRKAAKGNEETSERRSKSITSRVCAMPIFFGIVEAQLAIVQESL